MKNLSQKIDEIKEGDAAVVGGTAAPGVTAGDGGGGIAPGTPRGVLPSGNACWNVTNEPSPDIGTSLPSM